MMPSTTNLSASSLDAPFRPGAGAATRPARGRGLLFALLIVAGGGAAWSIYHFGLVDRLLGGRLSTSSLHVVRPMDLTITLTETGELKPLNSVEVLCDVEGQSTIRTVVAESTSVKKGDLLVELASDELTDRLDQAGLDHRQAVTEYEAAQQELAITRSKNSSQISAAEISVKVKELELKQYELGEYIKSMKAAEIDIEQTVMDIKQKEEDLTKNRSLAEKGFVTKAKLEELEFALKKSRMELEKNELAKVILEKFDNPKNMTQKKSDLKQAEDELGRVREQASSQEKQAVALVERRKGEVETTQRRLERAQKAVERAKILAPADGIVKYAGDEGGMRFGNDQRIAPGQKVFEGQALISLPDTSQMVVSTRIHEADRHKIREGLTCIVRVPAVPNEVFTGKLGKISQFADSAHRWFNPELKEHTAQIMLDNTSAPVSPGDTAQIEIMIETATGVLAVPVQCVFAAGSKNFVYVEGVGGPELREVKIGRSSTKFVELVSGVANGESVHMHATDEMLAKLPAADAGGESNEKTAAAAEAKRAAPRSEGAARPAGEGRPAGGGRGAGGGRPSGGGRPQ